MRFNQKQVKEMTGKAIDRALSKRRNNSFGMGFVVGLAFGAAPLLVKVFVEAVR